MELINKEMLIDSLKYLDFINIYEELNRLLEDKDEGEAVAYISLKDGNVEYRYEEKEEDEAKNALVEIFRKDKDKTVFNIYVVYDIEYIYKNLNIQIKRS